MSVGLSLSQARRLAPLMAYKLPKDAPPDVSPEAAPSRFAWVRLAEGGSALVHAVSAGTDPNVARGGNVFAHLVCGLPSDFDAIDAISLWGSEFWRNRDDGGSADVADAGTQLPSPSDLPKRPVAELAAWAAAFVADGGARLVSIAADAILRGRVNKIYVVAPPATVARFIAALALVLPPSLRRELKFSTYEADVLNSDPLVVGTCLINGGGTLPDACAKPNTLVFNTFDGSLHPAVTEQPALMYVQQAIRYLAANRADDLNQLTQLCAGVEAGQPELVDGLCILHLRSRAGTMDEPTAADQCVRFANSGVYRRAIIHSGVVSAVQIISAALSDPGYARAVLPPFISDSAGVEFAEVLRAAWVERVAADLRANIPNAVQRAVGPVLEVLAGAPDSGRVKLVRQLLTSVDPVDMSWPLRCELLRSLRLRPEDIGDHCVEPWLSIVPAQLPELLTLPISRRLKVRAAGRLLLAEPGSASAVVSAFGHPAPPETLEKLSKDLLERLVAEQSRPEAAATFAAALFQSHRGLVNSWLKSNNPSDRGLRSYLEECCTALEPSEALEFLKSRDLKSTPLPEAMARRLFVTSANHLTIDALLAASHLRPNLAHLINRAALPPAAVRVIRAWLDLAGRFSIQRGVEIDGLSHVLTELPHAARPAAIAYVVRQMGIRLAYLNAAKQEHRIRPELDMIFEELAPLHGDSIGLFLLLKEAVCLNLPHFTRGEMVLAEVVYWAGMVSRRAQTKQERDELACQGAELVAAATNLPRSRQTNGLFSALKRLLRRRGGDVRHPRTQRGIL